VALGVLAAAPAVAGAATCAGRYAVTQATGALVAGPGDVIVLDATNAVLDPACGEAPLRARGRRRLAARWIGCRERRVLRMKLRASDDCTLVRGTVTAPGARASRLVAVRSRCGDGVVDAGAGERCDDGNFDPGDGCDGSCGRCVDPSTLHGTYEAIQANVFDAACIVCHGAAATAGLDVRAPGSYERIVGVPTARGIPQIAPGARTQSLIWLKLAKGAFGGGDETLGGGMPFGYPLPAEIVEAFGRWIDAGAPASGVVPGTEALFVSCGG
jgi:cysteine-rich repeat protein